MSEHDVKEAARAAREELSKVRREPMPTHPEFPPDDTHRWWYERYTPLLCDFMCEEMADEELGRWREPFTALHEMMAEAYATWTSTDAVSDRDAWERFDPNRHLLMGSLITLQPPHVDILDFVPLFQRFTRYLGRLGLIPGGAVERILRQYDEAEHAYRDADAQFQDEWDEWDVHHVGGDGSIGHLSLPLPGGSAATSRRDDKTDYLIDRLLKSRQGRELEPGIASFAVHVLVADHVDEHGHRDWAQLDVSAPVHSMCTSGGLAPGMESLLVDAWRAFVDWLEAKDRLAPGDAARIRRDIEAALVTLSGAGARAAS